MPSDEIVDSSAQRVEDFEVCIFPIRKVEAYGCTGVEGIGEWTVENGTQDG